MPFTPIRNAEFRVAGLGLRLLSVTRSVLRGLLPAAGRPPIQSAADEAREAVIAQRVFVTRRGKAGILAHCAIALEPEHTMTRRGRAA